MQGPQFEKLVMTEDFIEAGREYIIPAFNPTNPTYVGARKGKTALFYSDSELDEYRSKKWHFWKIPQGAKAYLLPDFRETIGGFHCGEPTWCF